MSYAIIQIARVAVVIGLVVWAAVLVTPKGRLPLAVRGLARMLRKDAGSPASSDDIKPVSGVRRFFAFLLVLLAALVAII